MLKIMQNIKQYWLDFVKDNELNKELNSIIKDSWIRSKNYGVNFVKTEIKKASKEKLNLKIKQNEELVLIAHPIMENLYSIVSESGFVMILTDKEGCIIDMVGDEKMMKSKELNFEIGAFTGASKDGHPGKFELANGGTIFLDEIGELPLDMQSKLLRVLDNNRITRVGGTYEKILNVRVIAATNRNLLLEIENKNFREDLYYRLNVMSIKTIPLEERVEDIETLACYFVHKLNSENLSSFKTLENSYLDIIKKYHWPGNVRELRNIVERSYYLCESNSITEEYLHDYIVNKRTIKISEDKEILTIEELEKENIEKAIKQNKGDLVRAAHMLSISRATIYRKVKKYKIKV